MVLDIMSEKSRLKTELDLLSALEEGGVTTQMRLSKRISVSVGLINALLKRALKKGLVKVRTAPYKRYAYYLTPQGFSEKSRLVAEYLETSLDFFRMAKSEYTDLFNRSVMCGRKKAVLFGDGELLEIALISARDTSVEIVALFDPEEKSNNDYAVYNVPQIDDIDDISHFDVAVIVASRHPQKVYEFVQQTFSSKDIEILAPSFLRISRAANDLKKKVF